MNFDVSCHVKSGNQEVITKVAFNVEINPDSLTDFVEELKHAIEGQSMHEEIQRAWTDRSDMATKRYEAEKRVEELQAKYNESTLTLKLWNRLLNQWQQRAGQEREKRAEVEAENEAVRRGNIDLIAQVKELESDRKRLDWVESVRPDITEMKDNSVQVRTVVDWKEPAYKGMTVRQAIDTAMRAEGVGQEGTPDAL